jgi:hypothetical protein
MSTTLSLKTWFMWMFNAKSKDHETSGAWNYLDEHDLGEGSLQCQKN